MFSIHEVIKILLQKTIVGVLIIMITLIITEEIMHAKQSKF